MDASPASPRPSRMRAPIAIAVLIACTGWVDAPDGLSARTVDGSHAATLSCSPEGSLRVEVDAPEGTGAVVLANAEMSMRLQGRTADGRFRADLPREGVSVLFLRGDGSLRVGDGAGSYAMAWSGAGPVIDRLAKGCGSSS